uniref:Secreted protein n=1 Tax=Anopheles atroparvus TaxID=41427 RepID=A0AAG5D9T6_ANOAO
MVPRLQGRLRIVLIHILIPVLAEQLLLAHAPQVRRTTGSAGSGKCARTDTGTNRTRTHGPRRTYSSPDGTDRWRHTETRTAGGMLQLRRNDRAHGGRYSTGSTSSTVQVRQRTFDFQLHNVARIGQRRHLVRHHRCRYRETVRVVRFLLRCLQHHRRWVVVEHGGGQGRGGAGRNRCHRGRHRQRTRRGVRRRQRVVGGVRLRRNATAVAVATGSAGHTTGQHRHAARTRSDSHDDVRADRGRRLRENRRLTIARRVRLQGRLECILHVLVDVGERLVGGAAREHTQQLVVVRVRVGGRVEARVVRAHIDRTGQYGHIGQAAGWWAYTDQPSTRRCRASRRRRTVGTGGARCTARSCTRPSR